MATQEMGFSNDFVQNLRDSVAELKRNAAISRLYEKLRHGYDGDIIGVKTIPQADVNGSMTPLVDFDIKIIKKYGIRWYAMKPTTQKRWQNGKAIIIDNSTLLDWCTHIEERED